MKALSIQQPWAWLILNGHKDVENRSWSTRFRGEFAIHAGKTFDVEGFEYVQSHLPDIELPKTNEFEMGGIVGTACLTRCVSDSDEPDEEEDPFDSEWFFGDFGFVLEEARPCKFISLKGSLGFFAIPESVFEQIYSSRADIQ